MKRVVEGGNTPPYNQIHTIRCRECECLYTAQTEDAYKIYNFQGYWELVMHCPTCKTKNITNVSKPDRSWEKHLEGVDTNVEVEEKAYNGTF